MTITTPHRATRTYTQRLVEPPADVLPLLSPRKAFDEDRDAG